jgi:hypothetical protein
MNETTTSTLVRRTARPGSTIPERTHVAITTENGGRASGFLLYPCHVPDRTGLGDATVLVVDDFTGLALTAGTPLGPLATVTETGAPALDHDVWLTTRNAWLTARRAER